MKDQLARRLTVAGATLLTGVVLTACGNDGAPGGTAGQDTAAQASTSAPAGAAYNPGDVSFATAMIPHHQQAVEMAEIAASRATNPQVKALADRIATAQGPELTTMSGWLREWGRPLPSATPGMGHDQHTGMPGMMTDQEMSNLMAASGTGFDRMFLQMMIRHHEGAIQMATTEQQEGRNAPAKQLAEKIEADQTAEIGQMRTLMGTL